MKIYREWAMPNSNTFEIEPIRALVSRYLYGLEETADPFANKNTFAKYRNDLDPQYSTEFNMDAIDFLKSFGTESLDAVLFDPPYSSRQVSECYKALGKTVNMETTQGSFWGDMKYQIGRILKPGGIAISFGWNSGGIGAQNGCEIIEILLVPHGGIHYDTICTVDRKFTQALFK